MAKVYIAGPVIRPIDGPPWSIRRVYAALEKELLFAGHRPQLPTAESPLDFAQPRQFYQEVSRRIEGSDFLIAVIAQGDISAGIEAYIASTLSKPFAVLTEDPGRLPRMLVGAPGFITAERFTRVGTLLRDSRLT